MSIFIYCYGLALILTRLSSTNCLLLLRFDFRRWVNNTVTIRHHRMNEYGYACVFSSFLVYRHCNSRIGEMFQSVRDREWDLNEIDAPNLHFGRYSMHSTVIRQNIAGIRRKLWEKNRQISFYFEVCFWMHAIVEADDVLSSQ